MPSISRAHNGGLDFRSGIFKDFSADVCSMACRVAQRRDFALFVVADVILSKSIDAGFAHNLPCTAQPPLHVVSARAVRKRAAVA
jgi:hypothetical protein